MPDNDTHKRYFFRQWLYRCRLPLGLGLPALLISLVSQQAIIHSAVVLALIFTWMYSIATILKSKDKARIFESSDHLLSLSDEISEQVKNETSKLQNDLNRINSLLSDSISVLQENFSKITKKTEVQNKNISKLIDSLSNKNSNHEDKLLVAHFASRTSTVMQFFFDRLAQMSNENIATVDRINELTTHLDSMFVTLDQVNQLSEQTNLLAKNSAIQAARAGGSDLGFGIVADEVRSLSLCSNDLNTDMRVKMQQFKDYMTGLSTAANNVANFDMDKAVAHKESIDKIVIQIADQNAGTQQTLDNIDNTANFIDGELNDSIRALQYEDIVSQLSNHIHERLHHVNELSSMLGQVVRAEEQGQHEIEILRQKLAANRANNRQHAIAQESMDEGDVELF